MLRDPHPLFFSVSVSFTIRSNLYGIYHVVQIFMTLPSHIRSICASFKDVKPFLRITLILLFLAGCDKNPDAVIDNSGRQPNLVVVVLTTPSFNTDTILVHGTKSADDQLTLPVNFNATIGLPVTKVQSFHYTVTRTSDGVEVSSGYVPLTGLEKLQVQSIVESITLQKSFSLNIQRSDIGIFEVEISAIDESGFESNAFRLPLSILRLNRPPQISNLDVPDTLQVPLLDPIYVPLSVDVFDPDGSLDISRVQFTSILPDGTPSKSGPIRMYDDGSNVDLGGGYTSGDMIAADGVYTRVIVLTNAAVRGTYTFTFTAIDRSSDTSNVIIHSIVVE